MGKRVLAGNARCLPKDQGALFLPYQKRWIKDESRIKLYEKSRQIGISWASAYRRVRCTGQRDARYDSWISSRDEGQAVIFLEDCKAFGQILDMAARDYAETLFVDDRGNPFKAFVHEFSNGKKIHSMSSNPDAQAGKRGSRLLDEAALHKDFRKLYAIAYPGITWGGQLEIVSTHRGNLNFFNELVKEVKEKGNPKKISLHTTTLQDALDEGFLFKLQQKLAEAGVDDERLAMDESDYFEMVKAECPDEETFLQEFMCVPADDASAFLEWDILASAEYSPQVDWEYSLDQIDRCVGEIYVGVDIGRHHDLTVIWVAEYIGGVFLTRKVIEMKKATFAEQKQRLWEIMRTRRIRRCCIDATGLGMQMAEEAKKEFGYLVEEVTFTANVKTALAYPLRATFEERNIKIPERKEIRRDLRAVKKETTAAGNIRFSADTGPDGHSDRFWALALMIHGREKSPELDIAPIPVKPSGGAPRSGFSSGTGNDRAMMGLRIMPNGTPLWVPMAA